METETPGFRATAYLKKGCPYSFKYLLFMAEAQLLDRIKVVCCDPKRDDFAVIKNMLTAATGKPATFPTVEVEHHRYVSDSEQLIEHYAKANNVSPRTLTAFSFYKDTIFPQLEELHNGDK